MLLLVPNVVAAQVKQDSVEKIIDFQTRKFRSLVEALYEYSKDSVDIYRACDSAFSAMFKSVNPQNAYYPKAIWNNYINYQVGKTASTGIRTTFFSDSIFIYSIDKFSPAEEAGILRGSWLVSVNGIAATMPNIKQLDSALKCNPGDTVSIKWMNYNSLELKESVLVCKEYEAPSISAYFVFPDKKTAYILLSHFSSNSLNELKSIANELEYHKLDGIIFDLRNNSGGVVDIAIAMIDEFIAKGDTIFKNSARKNELKYEVIATDGGIFENMPLLVLINHNSASASEIFAGAIQDLDRGIIIGERSYGKGSIQKSWGLIDTTGYRITIAEFTTPSGRTIEKKNVQQMEIDPALKLMNPEVYDNLVQRQKSEPMPTHVNVFKSKKGKNILEMGGISPDVKVNEDSLSLLTETLVTKGILLEFAFKNHTLVPAQFRNNINKFLFEYVVGENEMQLFRQFSYNIKRIWNDEMYAKDKEAIRSKLKACFAQYFWDDFGFQAVNAISNPTVAQAIKSKQQAKQMLK